MTIRIFIVAEIGLTNKTCQNGERIEGSLRCQTKRNLPTTISHWGKLERLDQTKVEPRVGQPITCSRPGQNFKTLRGIDRRGLKHREEKGHLLDYTLLTYQMFP